MDLLKLIESTKQELHSARSLIEKLSSFRESAYDQLKHVTALENIIRILIDDARNQMLSAPEIVLPKQPEEALF